MSDPRPATTSSVDGYRCTDCGAFVPENGDWDDRVREARDEGHDDGLGAGPACPVCPMPYAQISEPVTALFLPREVPDA